MKKTIISFQLVLISSGLLYVTFTSQTVCSNKKNRGYEMKMLFEKELSNPDYSDFCGFYKNGGISLNETRNPFGPSPTRYYGTPKILYVDSYDNIYLQIRKRVEIIDNEGNTFLSFNFPGDTISLDFFSWSDDHFYLFLTKLSGDDEYRAFDMNLQKREIKSLEKTDVDKLPQNLLPDPKHTFRDLILNRIHSISDEYGSYYGLAWGNVDLQLYNTQDGRFIDPFKINVLKYDTSFKNFSSEPTYLYLDGDKAYLFDSVDVEKIFNAKVILIGHGNSYINKNGDIYLAGIKSNEAQRIFVKSHENYDEYDVNVMNPVFFMAKLERK